MAVHNLFLSSLSAMLLTATVCALAYEYRQAGGGVEARCPPRPAATRRCSLARYRPLAATAGCNCRH